ncbi:MAG: hypothetical protein IJJ14_00770 [Coriobacteriales bacterium]|nr:hypothetical protein [Coriobacteriales bacterium]MBQ6585526.1 hypothetical protein [Coriobacteriales bacterium]
MIDSQTEGIELPDELLEAVAGGRLADIGMDNFRSWLAFAKEKGFDKDFALATFGGAGLALADGFTDKLASMWDEI